MLLVDFPTTQGVHSAAADADHVLTSHSTHALDPGALYLPAPQAEHVAADVSPGILLYLPAAQFVHVLGPVAPKTMLYLPDRQSKHVLEDVAPITLLYLP